MELQITESRFNQVWGKSDLETAVIIFQDEIPELAREKFDIHQWTVVRKFASSKSKIKKEAWKNIERLATNLDFSKASELFLDSFNDEKLKLLMLSIICSSAKTPHDIDYCISVLDDNDERVSGLLDRLSKANGLFADWTAVFLNSKNANVQMEAFAKAEKAEATFEEWETFNRECRACYRESYCKPYSPQRFAQIRKRADTFEKKFAVYDAFKEEKSLVAEILKDMENTAEKPRNLSWVYDLTKSESVRKKILVAQDNFNGWLYLNQTSHEDWLKELSLKRMKEMAENYDHWSIIWCRDSSEIEKKKAVSNMIKMARNRAEAKLAYYRALGTSLERKAREKLEEIVSAS